MTIEHFRDDDRGYLDWLGSNDGFVINIQASLNPSDARLHDGSCHTIRGELARGRAWTGPYVKVCSPSLGDLDKWALEHLGTPIRRCGTCQPPAPRGGFPELRRLDPTRPAPQPTDDARAGRRTEAVAPDWGSARRVARRASEGRGVAGGALLALSDAERAEAVTAFNQRYGEMERVLWCLSQNSRTALIAGEESAVVERLVRTIRHWWGIQGAPGATATAISQALVQMEWSSAMFDTPPVAESAAEEACDRVLMLVDRSRALGVPRREVSWSSKVLHWLLPWRVPVFDKNVRDFVGVHGDGNPGAYRAVAQEVFAAVHATAASDPAWLGSLEPRAPLRGMDKCAWWLEGGNRDTAYVDPDPWRVVRELGLDRTD